MIDFLNKEEQIKTFIETNFPTFVQSLELPAIDKFIDDYVDLDKYKYNNEVFYNFNGYHFEDLSNDSNSAQFDMTLYFALRGDTPANLREKMLGYATAFYSFFDTYGDNFNGLFDFGTVTDVSFYNAAEGTPDCKVCSMSFRFFVEV